MHQLRQTFAANAKVVAADPEIEWCIVGFGSQDDLGDFMRSKLGAASVRVVYVKELSGRPWHLSVAKNVAHRLGRGGILVNLDCDNFIGDALPVIRRHFAAGCKVLHMWSGVPGDGTGGRIAMDREVFHALGGYDEAFYPMGYQDFDLVRRAAAMGFPSVRTKCESGLAIRNTKVESIRHCASAGLSWNDFNRLNRAQSMANIAAGRLVANTPNGWAPMNVETTTGVIRDDPASDSRVDGSPSEPKARRPFFQRLRDLWHWDSAATGAPHASVQRREKTVLMAWELGRGMGHINRLLPLAAGLAARGYRIVFALRSQTDLSVLAPRLPDSTILAAPIHRHTGERPAEAHGPVYNYADVLFRCGYASAATLHMLVRHWHELFATVGPDLIVCDHSPTVVLAAAGRIPTIHVGSGFTNPPAGRPFLGLHAGSRAGAEEREARVLGSLQQVRSELGATAPAQVSDLFDWAESYACCLPELDPYAAVRSVPAIGPIQKLPAPLPPGDRAFVFGYLAGQDERVAPLLRSLVSAKVPCCLYSRQAPPEWESMLEGTSVKLFDAPQRLPEALTAAAAVLHHGGLSTAELALAAGRPQFLVPRYLEQSLTADQLQRMSCGINLTRQAEEPGELIKRVLRQEAMNRAATAAAHRLAAMPRADAGRKILEACLQVAEP